MQIRTLSPHLAEKARVELNEDPKRIASDLQHIKDWLAKQPHINARTEENLEALRSKHPEPLSSVVSDLNIADTTSLLAKVEDVRAAVLSFRSGSAGSIDAVSPQHFKGLIGLNGDIVDQWLIAFLRGCKHSLEKAKEKLDVHYTLRTLTPELYEIRDHYEAIFDEFMDMGVFLIMPQTETPNSPRFGIVRPGKVNPEKHNMICLLGVITAVQKLLLLDDDIAVVNGTQWLVDLEGLTMAHILQVTPSMVMKMSKIYEDASPLRVKGSHFLNGIAALDKFVNLMKSMLNEKNRNRIFMHGKNFDSLYSHIPKNLLPTEYGGNGGPIKEITDAWKAKRRQYSSWLEEDMKYKTDESKRPGKPKTAESLFGIDGSFRQLEFD